VHSKAATYTAKGFFWVILLFIGYATLSANILLQKEW